MQIASKGFKVGILDCDIYGPSIPTIFGLENEITKVEEGKFTPLEFQNIKVNSIGFMVKEESALAWRGPMITKAITQLLNSTNWGKLDYLIVDMPPGTGDIHLTFARLCKIFGSIIVSTPDKIALKDVQRSIDLYRKLNINIIGAVENMSYIETLGTKQNLFGSDSMIEFSKKNNINYLAKLPLIPNLSSNIEFYNSSSLNISLDWV
jgi:ATP-binding protein involved in chromosome partitioning